jgi:hypothetical protein
MIIEKKLKNNSFEIEINGQYKNYHVPCTFYVWTKNPNNKMKNKRRWPPKKLPQEFEFLKRGDKSADFVLNGNSGKVRSLSAVTNWKSEHYIKVIGNFNLQIIRSYMSKLEFDKKSSVNGGNYWINQDEIIFAWEKFLKNNKNNRSINV